MGGALSRPAKSSLPIGASLHVTSNRQSRDHPFFTIEQDATPNQHRPGPRRHFGVLDGCQRAAICRNCRAKTWGTHKDVNGDHRLAVKPDTSCRTEPASMELPNGVSGINGKRWMSTSVKERWVSNFNGREVGEVNDPQPYLTIRMNEM